MAEEPFKPDDIVKTCCNIESGIFFGFDGLRSCSRGALVPPMLLSTKEMSNVEVSRLLIIDRRKKILKMLNDDQSDIACKNCLRVERKRYGDIVFSKLGHLDLQHYTMCNLRCCYCRYAVENIQYLPQYDALSILKLFSPDDIEWNAYVDFAGGEPTLLDNLKEYLDFFARSRIRVIMYTNSVRFHQAIYDGLMDGSIYMVTTSLDAGTPSTFQSLRGANKFLAVLETLSRYTAASIKGNSIVTVKYIFCESNCNDDDIVGFAYTMLALRPQQVWLTFDFNPLLNKQFDYDYSKQIEAYTKLYFLLNKHGIQPFHYFKEAIASVSREGRVIMNRVISSIDNEAANVMTEEKSDLIFKDFRRDSILANAFAYLDKFSTTPLKLKNNNEILLDWNVDGKKVLLIPATPLTREISIDQDIQKATWIGFVDGSPIQQGKMIEGRMIYAYEEIRSLDIDVILIAPPEKHRQSILNTLSVHAPAGIRIVEYEPKSM